MKSFMTYLNELLKVSRERGFYTNVKIIDDVPYPELIINGKRYLCLCSNNYLGLSIHPEVKKAAIQAIERYGIGTCESRLVAGNLSILEELEQAIAEFRKTEASVVFLSGYLTNVGVIPAIMDSFNAFGFPTIKNEDNLIIKDALSHMSIVDGCRLSRSPVKTYMHNDMNHLESILKRNKEKRKLIVTDGVFSMDGDMAPLPDLIDLSNIYDAVLMIDDAHATGVIGENGRGTPEFFGVEGKVDLIMGTLSKAFGALGGYLAGESEVIQVIKMKANPYIFTSSLPPEQVLGIMAALKIIQTQPELRARLWNNVHHLKSGLKEIGFNLLNTETQIIPILIGSEEKAIEMEEMLFERGILAPAIGWPAVPVGKSRIRCMPMATHTDEQIDFALNVFEDIGKELKLLPRKVVRSKKTASKYIVFTEDQK
ncbi:MAG: aminotransferase class I/II-fold pyridoxal phosphate-dependent enzyme [bacterium]